MRLMIVFPASFFAPINLWDSLALRSGPPPTDGASTTARGSGHRRSTVVFLLSIAVFFCIALISIQSSLETRGRSEYRRSFGSHRFSAPGSAMCGFVISDWQGIDRITSPPGVKYSYSVNAGLGAGIDMIMVPYNHTAFIDALTEQVKKNAIPMSRIDDAVRSILRIKFMLGLFEYPLADTSFVNQLGSKEHRELAREAVRN